MPRFFVGSSKEHRKVADEICAWIEEVSGCQAVHWADAFAAGDELFRKLLELAHTMDGAVFVFGPDDKAWYRKSEIEVPRDNVVFEYGLFTGRHGIVDPKRVIICRVAAAKVASDLLGITFVQFDPSKIYTAKQKILRWVTTVSEQCGAADSAPTISRHSKSKKELFEEGTRLIDSAQKTIFLCAKTPIPLVGPRPYKPGSEKYDYEEIQYQKYWKLAERASRSEIRFVMASSLPCIKAEIAHIADKSFHENVRSNLGRLFKLAEKSKSFQLLWYDGQSPTTFLVVDDDSLVWFKGENGDNVWVRDRSRDLATALRSIGTGSFRQLTLDQVKRAIKA